MGSLKHPFVYHTMARFQPNTFVFFFFGLARRGVEACTSSYCTDGKWAPEKTGRIFRGFALRTF
jgi:hypothetical protein